MGHISISGLRTAFEDPQLLQVVLFHDKNVVLMYDDGDNVSFRGGGEAFDRFLIAKQISEENIVWPRKGSIVVDR
jgi:hypothetical protein